MGANVHRLFWSIIPPFKSKYLPAVIVHDYLCKENKYEKKIIKHTYWI